MTSPLQNKVVSLSNARPPTARDMDEFEPSPAQEAIAAVLASEECPATPQALAECAGCDVRTVQRALSMPAFLSWAASLQSRLVESRVGAVHARLLHKALTEKGAAGTSAIRLYLERFDPEFKKQKVAERGGIQANSFSFVSEMDHDELHAFIARATRQQLGQAPSRPLAPPGD